MNLKSGVYFVHYDDIPAFVETAKAQGRYFCAITHQSQVKNIKIHIDHSQLTNIPIE